MFLEGDMPARESRAGTRQVPWAIPEDVHTRESGMSPRLPLAPRPWEGIRPLKILPPLRGHGLLRSAPSSQNSQGPPESRLAWRGAPLDSSLPGSFAPSAPQPREPGSPDSASVERDGSQCLLDPGFFVGPIPPESADHPPKPLGAGVAPLAGGDPE
jgi:hypothetical protein